MRTRLMRLLAVFAVLTGISLLSSGPAQAYGSMAIACGSYAPSTGWVNSIVDPAEGNENTYTLRVDFVMNAAEVSAAQCAGDYVEVSARIKGFSLPDQFDDYSVATDIPGAVHDLANSDDSSSLSPGVTAIPTADLVPDQWYYFELQWQDDGAEGDMPHFNLEWAASHWANQHAGDGWVTAAKEKGACALRNGSGNDAWCIFAHETHDWSGNEIGREWIYFPYSGRSVIQFN